ncbi:MAG: hypothetical protein Q9163_003886 [Psora crenata]
MLSRPIVEAPGHHGDYLRNWTERIRRNAPFAGPQRANLSRCLSYYVRICPLSGNNRYGPAANLCPRFGILGPGFFALPEYLAKSQYQSPDDPVDGAFQLSHGTKDHFFEWLSKRPELMSQFQNHMAGYRTGRPSWMDPDFYPVEKNLVEGAKTNEDSVFLVDVGGGKGHDLLELHRKHPKLPGKLILQDMKDVIAEAQATGLNERVTTMEHDFFTEQPILGARAYYMHSCLHDWPDKKAYEILTGLKHGMTKGYSKLLINENVIPDQGAHWLSTALDMVMMSNFSASERTEQNWRALLESAGFRIVKIWTYEPGTESLIEAELA